MQNDPIDYDQLAALCWLRGSMMSPSQLQGYLFGRTAVAEPYSQQQWLAAANTLLDPVDELDDNNIELLTAMYNDSFMLLETGNMEVQLMLPEVELHQRAECLAMLCQGFLQGFAEAGKERMAKRGKQQFPKMVAEALNDIAAIAQLGLEEQDNDANAERNLMELAEHVRLAIINIYLECAAANDLAQTNKPSKKLH